MTNLLSFNHSSPSKSNFKIEKSFVDQQFHQACGHGVDSLLIKAMKAQSLDNLSVVMIGLKGFYTSLQKAYKER